MHLKGTKRSKTTQNDESRQRCDTENRQSIPSGNSENAPANSKGNHFLELKRMVETMQANFLQEIASIKANLQSRPPSVPFTPQFSPNMAMHPPQAPVPFHPNPQRPMTFIPQSFC